MVRWAAVLLAFGRSRSHQAEDRAAFRRVDARSYPGKGYDLICFFDTLHDLGDPVGAVRHAYEALSDDGR